jgi:tetratricopeptide (TPR) repeat protein/DNA-binding XRE family transcriptional regulator
MASARATRGWSQERLSEAAGVHVNTIKDLERSESPNPRLATLNRIAQTLGVPICDLISPEGVAGVKVGMTGDAGETTEVDVPAQSPPSLAPLTATVVDGPGYQPARGISVELPGHPQQHLEAIRRHILMEQRDQAFQLLQACADRKDMCPFYGECALQAENLGETELAIVLYKRALDSDRTNPDTIRNYADCLSVTGRWDEAEALYQELPQELFSTDPLTVSYYIDHLVRNIDKLHEANGELSRLFDMSMANEESPLFILEAMELFLVDLVVHHRTLSIPLLSLPKRNAAMGSVSTVLGALADKLGRLPPARNEEERRRRARLRCMIAGIQVGLYEMRRATQNYRAAIDLYSGVSDLDPHDHSQLRWLAKHVRNHWGATTLAMKLLRALLVRDPINERTWEEIVGIVGDRQDIDLVIPRQMLESPPGRGRLILLDELFNPLEEDLQSVLENIRGELPEDVIDDIDLTEDQLQRAESEFQLELVDFEKGRSRHQSQGLRRVS